MNTKRMYPYYMLLPAVIFFFVFYALSIILGFGLSLTNLTPLAEKVDFVGLQNFRFLLDDTQFRMAFTNTLVYALFTVLGKVSFGLILALLLNRSIRGVAFYRAVFYMPSILSALVVGYIFKFIFQPKTGLLNNLLACIGLHQFENTQWLGVDLAMGSVIFVSVWMWAGYTATIYLAGLKGIPSEVLEAAAIDGASKFTIFRKITWHYLAPSHTVALTLNLIGGFTTFDLITALTAGGPVFRTEVLSTYLYAVQARDSMGMASAVGVLQFLIITIVTIPLLIWLKKREEAVQG